MCLEVLTAGSFRDVSLTLKEMGPFLPVEKFLELLQSCSYLLKEEAHTRKRAKQRDSYSSKADPLAQVPEPLLLSGEPSFIVEAGVNLALPLPEAKITLTDTAPVKILCCDVRKRAKDVKVI